jgi:hypothetical protein
MSQEPNRSMQPRPTPSGSTDAGILINQVMTLIEGLPESCQVELMKGFTGDLLHLAVKVQEIQATNAESQEHLSSLADLLSNVKRDGNRGYIKQTTQNAGGQTTVEISAGRGPLLRPVGGGCAVVLSALLTAGTLAAVVVFALGVFFEAR